MTTLTSIPDLESALVQEFQTLQALVVCARDQRRALVEGDLDQLAHCLARHQAIQSELGRLEEQRSQMMTTWAQQTGSAAVSPSLLDMLPTLEAEVASRLSALRKGILALAEELRDLVRGNQALAAVAMERVASVRDFLVSLAQPPAEGYQPWGNAANRVELPLVVRQWA